MNKLESIHLFIEKDVNEISLKKLLELEKYYTENKDALVKDFVLSLKETCNKAIEMQKLGKKEEVAYITYSMLRTEIIENKYNYLIEASNENWFLDLEECNHIYDAKWAFKFLEEFYEEINTARKVYGGLIGEWEVEKLKLKEAEKYNEYVIALARYSMIKAQEITEIKDLELSKEFELRVGQYRDISEIVYKIDKREKDSILTKSFFEEKDEDDEYSYEVYESLNLSNGDYKELDFRYCNFSESKFDKSNMKKSILLGANFNNASMREVDLRDSIIYEARFKGCDLSYSDLSRASGFKGLPSKNKWDAPGYEKVDFSNSNLEGVKFRNSDLIGAKFINATFKDTDFHGADLTDAIFSIEGKSKLNLSENQINIINWI